MNATNLIVEKTLKNGVEVVVVPTQSPVVSLFAWVDVGSIDEKPEEAGYCHFIEHMLFKGTKKRNTGQIAGAIEGVGGEMNAFTSFEYTAYHMTLAESQWTVASAILADMIQGSVFLKKEFDPEKQVILEEIRRGEDSPDRVLYQNLYRQLWGQKSFGRPIIGYPKTIERSTDRSLKEFWSRWYSPWLTTVVVAGGVDAQTAVAQIEKDWGKWTPRTAKRIRPRRYEAGILERPSVTSKSQFHLSEFAINNVRWASAVPGMDAKDTRLAALDAATGILGQGQSSRLYQRLFQELGVVNGVYMGAWAPGGQGLVSIDVEATPEQAGQFEKPLHEEIQNFLSQGPTAQELDRIKVNTESEKVYAQQNVEGLAHRYGYQKVVYGNVHADTDYLAQMRDLTVSDVREVAQTYFNGFLNRRAATSILFHKGFSPQVFSRESGIGDRVRSESKKLSRSGVKESKSTSRHQERKRGHGPAVQSMTLPNGLKLCLVPRSDVGVVQIQSIYFGGTRFEQPSHAGLSRLVAEMWSKGPKGMTSKGFAEAMESKASRIAGFSGRTSLGLTLTTLSRFSEEMLELYLRTLESPAWGQEDFQREWDQQGAELKTLEDKPSRYVEALFCKQIFGDHPYGNHVLGQRSTWERFHLGQCQEYFKQQVDPAAGAIAVVGRFSENAVLDGFSKLPKRCFNGAPAVDVGVKSKKQSWLKEAKYFEVVKGREQSHVLLGFPGLSIGDPQRFDLKVLNSLLGGQSGRLFRELRDKLGLCYVVAPMAFEGLDRGYFGVYMGCDPKKRTQAIDGIRSELHRLVQKPFSESEVKRAKTFLLGRHMMDHQLNSSIASSVALNSLYGMGSEAHLQLEGELKKVTAKSLRQLAERFLEQPEVLVVIV